MLMDIYISAGLLSVVSTQMREMMIAIQIVNLEMPLRGRRKCFFIRCL